MKSRHQVKEFSILLCTGRCKSLGLLKSFLSYTSQLSKAKHPVFLQTYSFLPWIPLGLTGSPWGRFIITDDCDILKLSCREWHACLRGSEIHIWRAGITDSFDILVCLYGRRYISQKPACCN